MRDINEISFDEFTETFNNLQSIACENKNLFDKMLLQICQECRLAREMLYFIINMQNEESGKNPEIPVEHHKAILAVWLLLNDYKFPNTTLH